MKTHYGQIKPFTTRDGSLIRELMHPAIHGNKNQSLAEATVRVAAETILHRHHKSEELYYITQGKGLMTLGEQQFEVSAGDTICINPGIEHKIRNIGECDLKILCCCSPAYSHDDTVLIE